MSKSKTATEMHVRIFWFCKKRRGAGSKIKIMSCLDSGRFLMGAHREPQTYNVLAVILRDRHASGR